MRTFRPWMKLVSSLLADCLLALALCLFQIGFALITPFLPDSRVKKILMPDDVDVRLDRTDYVIWVFTSWPSKGLFSSGEKLDRIIIMDSKIRPVAASTDYLGFFQLHEKPKHSGKPQLFVEIPKTDEYRISCKMCKCVVAIAPSEASGSICSGPMFTRSLDDDFGFVRKLHLFSPTCVSNCGCPLAIMRTLIDVTRPAENWNEPKSCVGVHSAIGK